MYDPKNDPLKGARVPITYAPVTKLIGDDTDDGRAEFLADNLRKLADFMEGLPPRQWDQCDFGTAGEQHVCQTTACALGWAAMTHIIPGLQYEFRDPQHPHGSDVYPLVNGEKATWDAAGKAFFGEAAWDQTFSTGQAGNGDIHALANQLRDHADYLA